MPTGVTGGWLNNVVTITGTATVTGTYTYLITLTGGCGVITKTGKIYVKPDDMIVLSSAAGTDSQTTCINTAPTNIRYTTTVAIGAAVTGLPPGMSGTWLNNVFTIAGTPTVAGTYSYTVITSGGCVPATITGTINVQPNNTITLSTAAGTDSQTLCINTAITSITYTTTGSIGATYAGLPAGVIGGWSNNVVTISGTPTVAGTYNYTITLTGGCGVVTKTGTIVVKPNDTIVLGSAAGTNAQTVCINTAPTTIMYNTTIATNASVIGLPTGMSGNWSGNVFTISGTPTVAGTYTYTVTTSGGCVPATATGTIVVKPDNTITLISVAGTDSQTFCIYTPLPVNIQYTTTIATSASATGLPTGLTGTWVNNIYTISGTPTVSGTYTYTVTTTGGCAPATATGTIVVNPNNTITLSSVAGTDAQRVCINSNLTTITFATTRATGATITGLPAGVIGGWSNNVYTISGASTVSGLFTYTITLTGGCGIITKTGSILVDAATVAGTISSSSGLICNGSTPPTISLTGNTGSTIVWQIKSSTPSATYTNTNPIRNGTSISDVVNNAAPGSTQVVNYYQALVQNGVCNILTTNSVAVAVDPTSQVGAILPTQSVQEVCIGSPATSIVLPSNVGTIIWQTASSVGGAYSNIPGQTTATLPSANIPTGTANTTYYKAQVTSGVCPSIYSQVASVQVDAATVAGTISSSSGLICNGSTPPTISLTGNTGSTIVWQIKSSTPSATYTNTNPIRNGTSISDVVNNAAPGSTQVVNYYQALVQNGVCNILTTNSVAVAVDPTSQVGAILPTQSVQEVCIGSPATSIVLPSNVGTIIWQTASSVGGAYSNIPGQTTATLPSANIPTGTANTTYYKAQVTSGVCPSIYSQVASVQVDAASVAGTVYYMNGNSPICNQGAKPTISLQNNTGNNIYWQISAPPISTISLGAGTSSLTYNNIGTTGALLNSTIDNTAPILNSSFRYYRAVVANGVCPADISTPIELEVIPTPLIDSIKPNERCGPGTIDLYAHSNLGIVNWFAANAGGNALSTSNNFTTPYLTKNINNYYVSGLFRGCSSLTRTAVLAEVITIPTVPPIPDSTYCGPHVFNICIKATDNGVVNWYTNPTGGNPFSIGDCYTTPVIRSNTTYYVDAAFRGCTTVTRTAVNAIIFEVPVIAAVPNLNLCVGNLMSVTRYASLGKPPYLYTFITDSSQVFGQISGGLLGLNPGASNTSNVNGQNSGTLLGVKSGVTNVIFNIKDKNNCVSLNSNTFSLKTYDPVKPLNFNYQAYYQDDLIIPTKKDSGYILYNWNPGMNLNFTNIPEPIFNGTNTTDYVLVRTDTTSYCTVADNYHIDVTKDFILDVPNAFTPNYDGLNDKLRIIANAGIESIENFAIFNREGIQVFPINSNQGWSSKSIQPNYENHIERVAPNNSYQANSNRGWDTWDGKDAQGKVLETDGYFWKAFIHFKDKSSKLQTGMFLLLK